MFVPTSSVNRIYSALRSVRRPLLQRTYRMIFQVLKTDAMQWQFDRKNYL
jgi:hypothetical protein